MHHRLRLATIAMITAAGLGVTCLGLSPAAAARLAPTAGLAAASQVGDISSVPTVHITTSTIFADPTAASVGLQCESATCVGEVWVDIAGTSGPGVYGQKYSLRAGATQLEFLPMDPDTVAYLQQNEYAIGTATASVIGGKTAMQSITFVYETPAIFPSKTEVFASGAVETDVVCHSAIPCSGDLHLRVAYADTTHTLSCRFTMPPQDVGFCDFKASAVLFSLAQHATVTGHLTGTIDNGGTLVDKTGVSVFSARVQIKATSSAHA